MKTLFSLFTFLVYATFACAQQVSGDNIGIDFYFATQAPVSYTYDKTKTGFERSVEPLVAKEVFCTLLVRDSRNNVDETTSPSFKIDAAGQIVKADDNFLGAAWQKLNAGGTDNRDYILVAEGDEYKGVPGRLMLQSGNNKLYGFPANFIVDVPGEGGYLYCYLIVLDTRSGVGECKGIPTHVKSYAAALCRYNASQTYFPAGDGPNIAQRFSVTVTGVNNFAASSRSMSWPGYDLPWKTRAEITFLVVDGEKLTGDTLAGRLTPSISKMAFDENSLSLTATALDVMYYTLYTKAALSETEWERFEDFVTRNKNSLDNIDGKRYTRFCIDGKSLSIPLVGKEASRFYMLSGE